MARPSLSACVDAEPWARDLGNLERTDKCWVGQRVVLSLRPASPSFS